MRIHKRLIDYNIYFKQHDTNNIEGHRETSRWILADSVSRVPSMDAPQLRVLEAVSPGTARIYLPTLSYHRMRVVVNNIGLQSAGRFFANFYTEPLGYVSPFEAPLPNNNHAVFEYDATQYASNEYKPSIHRLDFAPTNAIDMWRLCDVVAYAYAPAEPYLVDLIPVASQYEVSVFAPLTHNKFFARQTTSRAYKLTLLIPRSDPALEFFSSLAGEDDIEIEIDNRYIPCAIQSVDSQPTGGALWQMQFNLVATSLYAYSPIRYIKKMGHAGQDDLHPYKLPGDAPTTMEVRLLVNTIDANIKQVTVHAPPAGAKVEFAPDSVGVWSLHDSGRIYHIPSAMPGTIIDRTDALRRGALPFVVPPGDGYVSVEHSILTSISHVAVAAYPRYLLETTL